ncbi:hypothetical protein J41TS4_00870 [Paenibacillus apis]|uniref:Uncharacterized protein n=1 Tax=Paenibacillus apis TaxID=1792174 RepID=A0A920CKB5_9BACL|nr:hypothetical protein J41TS4_00870 [Paenibacillus apis]
MPTWVKRGYFELFDDYISSEMKENFKNVLIEEKNMVGGKIYTLPNIGQFWRLIYNVDLFEKRGSTGRRRRLRKWSRTPRRLRLRARTAEPTALPATSRAPAALSGSPIRSSR